MSVGAHVASSIGGATLIALLCGANCLAENTEQQSGSSATDTVTVLGRFSSEEAPESKSKEKRVAEQIEQLPAHDSTMEVDGGVFSIAWALNNPTEGWRILTPIPFE